MTDNYRMMPHGSEFILNHDAGGTVGVYKTEIEARQEIVDCQRDDLMLKTARGLVKKAVNALRFDYYFRVEAKARLRGRMVEVFSIFSIERRAATPTIRRTIYGRDARLV